MEASEFSFFLTGSRFWGNPTPDPDWDFFTNDCEDVRKWLLQNGFNQYSSASKYAGDGQCNDVFVLGNKEDGGNMIQIQVVNSAYTKNIIQDELYRLYRNGFSNKEHAREIWSTAFAIYNLCHRD